MAEKSKSKNPETRTGREVSFEAGIAGLEEIIGRFESGDLTLDQSLALFEQGITLAPDLRRPSEKCSGKDN